jgi:hypothetical protein
VNILKTLRSGLACAVVFALVASAAFSADEKQPRQLAEKTSDALKKFSELQQQKPPNFDAMLALVDSILPTVPAGSYDQAFLLDIKAKVFLQKDQLGKAIEPWEEVLRLQEQHQYFDEKYANDIVLYLAQIIFSETSNTKDPAQQQALVNRALSYLRRYLQNAKKPTPETQMFYAQLLYQQAAADPNHVNQDLLKQARDVVEKAMLTQLNPKEGFYMLYLAILQQQNETERAADMLELIVKKFPGKKDYWPALLGSYLNLASNEKNPERQREYYIRAINTLERAQKLGFMTDPKNNYNLVTIYLTAGQFGKATDLLHTGLKAGTIESSITNWRVLGSYYQQANKEFQAIDALKEAEKLYPKEGMLDLQIGEIYRQLDKTKEARDYYRSAVKKGSQDAQWKPWTAWQLLAYAAMEVDDWDEALRAITEAAKYPEFQKDKQMQALKKHIEDTVTERDELRKEKEAKQNPPKQQPEPKETAPQKK